MFRLRLWLMALALGLVGTLMPVVRTPSWGPRAPRTVLREVEVPIRSLPTGAGYRRSSPSVASTGRTTTATTICPSIHFTAFGLTWDQSGGGPLSALVSSGASRSTLGTDVPLSADDLAAPGPGAPKGRVGTELLWVKDASCVRFSLRLPGGAEISALRAVFINTSGTAFGGPPSTEGGGLEPGSPGLFSISTAEATASQPAMITRSQWGADESLRNCGPTYAPQLKMAFVHHTDTRNGYARSEADDIVRAIYAYHTQTRRYCDIAYNFLVDIYGDVFIGRYGGASKNVVPEGTTGFNYGSTMVAALGDFQSAQPPTAMINAIERTLAWRMDVAHINPLGSVQMTSEGGSYTRWPKGTVVTLRRVSGHRDTAYTLCPGDYLYPKMDEIRSAAYNIGRPKIFDPTQSVSSFSSGGGSVAWKASASDSITWLAQVSNAKGVVVRSWNRTGSTLSLTWDGRSASGSKLPTGKYTVSISGTLGSLSARGVSFALSLT